MGHNDKTAAQQGAAPDRLQPALVPRFGFRRRVSLVVLLLARGVMASETLCMGIRAYAKRITPEQLMNLQRDPKQVKDLLHIGYAWSYAADLLLEKDWHIIHFLLTGEVEIGDSPLHKAALGGTSLVKAGYLFPHSPPCYLTPEEVKEVSLALCQVTEQEMIARLEAAKTISNIYGTPEPEGWTAGDWEDLSYGVEELKDFFSECAGKNYAVLHYLA